MTNKPNRKPISDETIEYVSILAKLDRSPAEKEKAKEDMDQMLAYIDKLKELDTTEVEPLSHIFPMSNVFREDELQSGKDELLSRDDRLPSQKDQVSSKESSEPESETLITREAILKNAPAQKDGSFMVPKTIG